MAQDYERFMRMALDEAEIGGGEGNNAVGTVITRGDEVIAKGRNVVNSTHDFTAHCEIDALRNAEKSLGHFDFSGMTLISTAEPCPLCCGAIMLCGISTVVMGQRSAPPRNRFGDYTIEKLIEMSKWGDRIEVVSGVMPQECADMRAKWEVRNAA